MTAIAIAAAALVVLLALLALRSSGVRRDRRSMRRYGDALGVLGTISKRSDAVAPVQTPSGEAIARAHVGLHEEPAPDAVEEHPLPPRIRLEAPTGPVTSNKAIPVFGDAELTAAESAQLRASRTNAGALARLVARARSSRDEPTVVLSKVVPAEQPAGSLELDEAVAAGATAAPVPMARRRGGESHRAVLGAAAAVVVIAAVISGVVVGLHHEPAATRPPTSTTTPKPGGTSPTTTTTTTAPPTTLSPVSVSTSIVTYSLAAPSYTVKFAATGACWLGVQASANGSYLWMTTLSAGSSTSYSSHGPFVVRIGAPGVITVSVNGIPVNLPKGQVRPYDISFTAPTTAA